MGEWRLRALVAAGLSAALVTAAPPSLADPTLNGKTSATIDSGSTFPERSLTLQTPAGHPLTAAALSVTENGLHTTGIALTELRRADTGAVGVELVIDRGPTMSGSPVAEAFSSARALAAERAGDGQVGIITFAATPHENRPLTRDDAALRASLAVVPPTGTGAGLLPAVQLALRRLALRHLAAGVVVVLSDGAVDPARSAGAIRALAGAARVQGTQIVAVGIRSPAYDPSELRQLAVLTGGALVSHTPPVDVFARARATLPRRYLVRYRSPVTSGGPVTVRVHVQGLAGDLRLTYRAPAASPAGNPASSGSSGGAGSPAAGSAARPATPGTPAAAKPSHPTGKPQPSSRAAPKPPALPAMLLNPVAQSSYQLSPLPAFVLPKLAPLVPGQTSAFWRSSGSMFAVSGICALLACLAAALLLKTRMRRLEVRRRMNDFMAIADAALRGETAVARPAGLLERQLVGRKWWPGFVAHVAAARVGRPPLELVKRLMALGAAAALVVVGLSGAVILGLLVLVAEPFVVHAWLKHGARKQRVRFAEQLPTNLQDLAGAMRAGRSLIGAIGLVAGSSAEPMRGELDHAVTDERLGLPLDEALHAVAGRMEAKDMEQVGLIAALHRSSGSNVAEALDRVAEGARERADLQREMRALTSQARLSSWVLTGLSPALLLALTFIAPQYSKTLFHTAPGVVMLVIAGGMVLVGWKIMSRIVRPEA